MRDKLDAEADAHELEMDLRLARQGDYPGASGVKRMADTITALRAEVERLRGALAFIGHLATCDHGHAHYCPNCDRSLFEIGDTVQTALTQTKDTTDDA